MPGRWDTSTKRLVGENPEHFIKWLLPGAEFKEKAQSKPLNLNTREREVDALYRFCCMARYAWCILNFKASLTAVWHNGCGSIIHWRPSRIIAQHVRL